ncbi:hypothetical protein CAEBREN_01987 [Caenorhabditis brenneri]|uniref:Uncharacterized protein n=1 Tax=Caenorhabditis brenneri TaxID=135651 RepID=G0NS46_CAEBE|nr:hypothetical protein CAEBREN_01987 [Caenorhabditis brenneri]
MSSATHQYGSLTGTPGTSSNSGTGKSPSKLRNVRGIAKEMRKPKASATKSQMRARGRQSIWCTLEAWSSPDDKEMPSTIAAELRSISTQSTNLCHTSSISTYSTQLPLQLNSHNSRRMPCSTHGNYTEPGT